jgi:uncharacterized protein YjiK
MKTTLLFTAIIMATAIFFWKDIMDIVSPGKSLVKSASNEKDKKDKKDQVNKSAEIDIKEKWDLPSELKEVSGIAYLDEQRFACIQDEEGTIFIYNRTSDQIEKKIAFGAPGDYEGITVKGSTAFVVRADGRIYEVDMKSRRHNIQSGR